MVDDELEEFLSCPLALTSMITATTATTTGHSRVPGSQEVLSEHLLTKRNEMLLCKSTAAQVWGFLINLSHVIVSRCDLEQDTLPVWVSVYSLKKRGLNDMLSKG